MSINKTVVKSFSIAINLPVGDEILNQVNVMLMSLVPIFSCLEVSQKYEPPETLC